MTTLALEAVGIAFGLASVMAACHAREPDGEPVRVDAVEVRIMAQETSWHASYVVASRSGGTSEVPTDREVHLPLGATVRLTLASRSYICLFAMPELGLRDFAAPGLPAEHEFRAERPGSYELRGDELCGLPHTDKSRGRFLVEDPTAFRAWVHQRAREVKR